MQCNMGGNAFVVLLGFKATATAASQLIAGSADGPITSAYLGEGVTSASPQDFTMHATGGNASSVSAGDWILAGGVTVAGGAGIGGRLLFRTAGTDTLVTRLTIDQNGLSTFTGNVDATLGLDVTGARLAVTDQDAVIQRTGAVDALLHLEQTSSGDGLVKFSISAGTTWAAGVDNSDSDAFKICPATTLGGSIAGPRIAADGRLRWGDTNRASSGGWQYESQGGGTTSNASVSDTLWSFTLPERATVIIEAMVVVHEDGGTGKRASSKRETVAYRASGGAAVLMAAINIESEQQSDIGGSANPNSIENGTYGADYAVVFETTSNDVNLNVTQHATDGNNTWHAFVRWTIVTS
jgi:hypothetical protein